MNELPLHPAVVHLPLGLAFSLPLLAVGLAWAIWTGRLPRQAWLAVMVLQAVVVVSGIVAIQLADRDEERVEQVVSRDLVHDHEERAEAFIWTAGGILALALAGLLVPSRRPDLLRAALAAATVGTLVVAVLAGLTGHAGGGIVYGAGDKPGLSILSVGKRPVPEQPGRGDD